MAEEQHPIYEAFPDHGKTIDELRATSSHFKRLSEAGIYVLFVRFKTPIMQIFKRSHMYDDIDRRNFYRRPTNAFTRAWELLVSDERDSAEKPQPEQ